MTTATLNSPAKQRIVADLNAARETVERIKNDAAQQFPEAASIGDAVRQGDIYIQLIDPVTSAPQLYTRALQPVFPYQLAEGNSKGSRHCLASGNGVTIYEPVGPDSEECLRTIAAQYPTLAGAHLGALQRMIRDAEWEIRRKNNNANTNLSLEEAIRMLEFAGPILVLTEPNTITHPEHGDWLMPPGSYRITYQRTVARDNTITRVID
jgi:hypothetical protein